MKASKITRQKAFQRGVDAEMRVIENLQKQGFQLLNHRYKTAYGEIDVIMEKDALICFIEVKARKNLSDGLFSITDKAKMRISNSALLWMQERTSNTDELYRFDVAIVTGDNHISYLANAFEAPEV